MTSLANDPARYEAALGARRKTVFFLAALLHARRLELGTRRGTHAVGPFKHAVLALRW